MIRVVFILLVCTLALSITVLGRQQRVISDAHRSCVEMNTARVERNETGEILRAFLLEAQSARLEASVDIVKNQQTAARYGGLAGRIDQVEAQKCP